jgi:hypothetical protein
MISTPTAKSICEQVSIIDVYETLTGIKPRPTGANRARGRAKWRDGDGLNVSLDDSRGVWHDFVSDEGGGVLDLVQRIRGGSRQEALKWVADFAGVPLDDQPLSREQRREWALERRRTEQHMRAAEVWRRAAVNLTDELLDRLKTALFDPTLPWPEIGEIYRVENMLRQLQNLEGTGLVDEYLDWAASHPKTTSALVQFGMVLEAEDERMVKAYLMPENEAVA